MQILNEDREGGERVQEYGGGNKNKMQIFYFWSFIQDP